MSEHSGVTGKRPQTPKGSGRIAARDHRRRHGARGIIDLVAYLQDFWKKRHPGRLRSSVSGPLRGAGRHCRRALSFVTAYIRSTSA